MNLQEAPQECLIDGQLKCVEKRESTRRGVRFSHLKLQRSSSSYTVKFNVSADQAAGIQIGSYYKIAILPDRAPDAVSEPSTGGALTPGT